MLEGVSSAAGWWPGSREEGSRNGEGHIYTWRQVVTTGRRTRIKRTEKTMEAARDKNEGKKSSVPPYQRREDDLGLFFKLIRSRNSHESQRTGEAPG